MVLQVANRMVSSFADVERIVASFYGNQAEYNREEEARVMREELPPLRDAQLQLARPKMRARPWPSAPPPAKRLRGPEVPDPPDNKSHTGRKHVSVSAVNDDRQGGPTDAVMAVGRAPEVPGGAPG